MTAEEFALRITRQTLAYMRTRKGGEKICSDDCICPPGLTVTHEGVTRTNPALVCTSPDGHEGPHQAYAFDEDGNDVLVAEWSRGSGRAG